jgi:mono/diheme cytochrome c family protein
MSSPSNNDPRLDQAAVTDESLLAAHEKLLGKQPDEKAHYSLTPLALLFVFSGLIFWAGTYLNRYSGKFDPLISYENAKPTQGGAVAVPQDPLVVGKAAYGQVCIQCHQPTGLGLPGVYPPLAGSEWVQGSEERVIRIVLYGLKGPLKVKGTEFGNAQMPSFRRGTSYNWSDEKIAAVLTYVRQEWGNKAAPIAPEKVAEIRDKIGDRAEWSQDELLKVP